MVNISWDEFEIKVINHLNKLFNQDIYTFEKIGGSDSNKSDGEIYKDGILKKNIEIKMDDAQAGQIVILPLEQKFILSTNSVYHSNPYTQKFIDYLNNNFKQFSGVSTSGIDVDIDPSIIAKWIKYHYTQNKNSDYIISEFKDNYIYIPLDNLNDYCILKATYRKKRSGTRELALKNSSDFQIQFQTLINSLDNSLIHQERLIQNKKHKTFIYLKNPLKKEHLYIEFASHTAFLSYKGTKKIENIDSYVYEVRQRSNTNNPNITFGFKLKPNVPDNFENFKNYLNNL